MDLLDHLRDQAATLSRLIEQLEVGSHEVALATVRDQLFVMQETLESLGVPLATAAHRDWQRMIVARTD